MMTFILGVSAAVVVGMLIWSAFAAKKANKRIESIIEERQQIWMEIEKRCDAIERGLTDIERELNRRIDENYSYTDSRFDKMENRTNQKLDSIRNSGKKPNGYYKTNKKTNLKNNDGKTILKD